MPRKDEPKELYQIDEIIKTDSVPEERVAKCYNEESTLSEDTKLVIVGTLTPPNTQYFYCSPSNRIYGYIDEAAKKCGKFKKSLKDLKQNKDSVETIKSILKEFKIAFLDVMGKAIRKEVSSKDSDIEFFCLADKEPFKNIPKDCRIVANSRLAEKLAEQLISKEDKSRFMFLSQRRGKKEDWLETIKSALVAS